MVSDRFLTRALSAFVISLIVGIGAVDAQKHGRGGGGGGGQKHDRGDGGQKHDRGQRGQREQWGGGGRGWEKRGGDGGGRPNDGGAWRQQRQQQVEQWRNAQRQQWEAARQQQQQWQQAQRQQQLLRHAQRQQQQQQWRDTQRQQHEWRQAQRQQEPRWNDSRRDNRRAERDQRREQKHWQREQWKARQEQWRENEKRQREIFKEQRRDWRQHRAENNDRDDERREPRRAYTLPRLDLGDLRRERERDRALDAERMRDALRAEQYAQRSFLRDRHQEQSFDNGYYSPRETYTQGYSYDSRPEVWFGDDYSDFARYSRYIVYTPSYPVYDAGYSDYPISSPYNYDDDLFGGFENDGFDWKSLLFRTVISAFFSNGDNIGYLDPYPEYASSPYDADGYGGYIPQYSYQEPYYTFGSAPTYAYYEPAAYYGYDQYADATIPAEYIPQESLPLSDMVDIYSGGFAGEFIQRALGTGYYQGLLEGQMARRQGWDDQYYNDPYLYEQALYDPYSSSMGTCRRYMSEGYEMGFQDALSGRDEFDLSDTGGDIDLVSLLLGSVLSLRS